MHQPRTEPAAVDDMEATRVVSAAAGRRATSLEDAPQITGRVAMAYLGHLMQAANSRQGVNAARLSADAVAAQRGDRAARQRLFAPIFPPRRLPGRVRQGPVRRSRRAGLGVARATRSRSPGRVAARQPSGDPDPSRLCRHRQASARPPPLRSVRSRSAARAQARAEGLRRGGGFWDEQAELRGAAACVIARA